MTGSAVIAWFPLPAPLVHCVNIWMPTLMQHPERITSGMVENFCVTHCEMRKWILFSTQAPPSQSLTWTTYLWSNTFFDSQPTGIFRSSDRITFSMRPMEYPGKSPEFHCSAPYHHVHRCPAVFVSRYETNRSPRLPGRLIRWMRHVFALQTRHFLWHNFDHMASRIVKV
jgi:hypothetical protein